MAERISVDEAQRRAEQGAWLICAYEDDRKCAKVALAGSIPLSALQQREVPRQQELIFYCA
jgi:hypothetical protein